MKRLFILIMTLLSVSTFISAEETYQEKVRNVYLNYACLYKYGPNVSYESLSNSDKAGLKYYASRDGVRSLEYNALDFFNSSQIKRYNLNMEDEIKELEKYKPATSNNQKNPSATKSKKNETELTTEELDKIVNDVYKKLTPEELERLEKLEWERYTTQNIKGKAEKYIADKINEWSVKDTYEKTSEYEERLRTKSDSLLNVVCSAYVEGLKNHIRFSVLKSSYDADKEQLKIDVEVWIDGESTACFPHYIFVKIPPKEARNFELWWLCNDSESISKRKIYTSDGQCTYIFNVDVKCSDGRIIDVGLYPNLLPHWWPKHEFVIDFDDDRLNVTNPYLKNRKYSFSKNSIVYTLEEQIQRVETKCDSVNNNLLKYPFNNNGVRMKCPTFDSLLVGAKDSVLSDKILEALNYIEKRESFIEDSLLQDAKKDTIRYVNTVLENDSNSKAQVEKQYIEYRCKYTFQQFAAFYLYNIAPDTRSCREEYREKYLYLFKYPHEFDSSYQRGESAFLADIDSRIRQRSEVDSFIKWLNNFTMLNLKKDYDEDVISIKNRYAELKDNMYLDDVKNALRNNEKLSAEWYKNGLWFASDYNAFITSYMSNHYKQDLKKLKN